MNIIAKTILGAGILLLTYSILSRLVPIYFFWESLWLSWTLIFTGIILWLRVKITLKKKQNKKTAVEKIIIALAVLMISVQLLFLSIIPFTDTYKTSKDYIINNDELIEEVGNINELSIIPFGNIKTKSDSSGKTGKSKIRFIVKGENHYKIVTIESIKQKNTEWLITSIK